MQADVSGALFTIEQMLWHNRKRFVDHHKISLNPDDLKLGILTKYIFCRFINSERKQSHTSKSFQMSLYTHASTLNVAISDTSFSIGGVK